MPSSKEIEEKLKEAITRLSQVMAAGKKVAEELKKEEEEE